MDLDLVTQDALSVEYVKVKVFADHDVLTDTVKIALTDSNLVVGTPTWINGEWVPGQTWVNGQAVIARALVGPLDAGTTYDVKVQVTDNPETPVITAYQLRAT